MFEYILAGIVLLIVIGGIVLFLFRKKYLTKTAYQKYAKLIDDTRSLDPPHAILESHKIFVLALKTLGGAKLPAARIIARHKKRFPHVGKIWEIHRLRNQLAHEINIKVTETDSENARKVLTKALKSITKR